MRYPYTDENINMTRIYIVKPSSICSYVLSSFTQQSYLRPILVAMYISLVSFYQILENADSSIVTEWWSVVAWIRCGRIGGEGGRIAEGHEDTFGVTEMCVGCFKGIWYAYVSKLIKLYLLNICKLLLINYAENNCIHS